LGFAILPGTAKWLGLRWECLHMVQTAGQRFFHFGKALGEIGKDLMKDGDLRVILAMDGAGKDGNQIHDAPQSGNLDVGVPDGSPGAEQRVH